MIMPIKSNAQKFEKILLMKYHITECKLIYRGRQILILIFGIEYLQQLFGYNSKIVFKQDLFPKPPTTGKISSENSITIVFSIKKT